jgi:hypothetical protein
MQIHGVVQGELLKEMLSVDMALFCGDVVRSHRSDLEKLVALEVVSCVEKPASSQARSQRQSDIV